MSRMLGETLLVGSVPLETAEEVFRLCARALGNHVSCLPDGEVGDRAWWIMFLAYRVFHGHPEIETLKRPAPVGGVEQWRPVTAEDAWQFKVREGVKAVRFGDLGWRLGYAKEAISSYFVFRTLRERGEIPANVRFQVCLPMTVSAVLSFFPQRRDYERVAPAYEEAMCAEIATMVKKIPPKDLAIQWDCCTEVLNIERTTRSKGDAFERNTAPFSRLSPHIAADVLLGYHFCYGTLGGWPMVRPESLELCVALANRAVERSARPVDFIHMPVPRNRDDDAYFAPLRNLRSREDVKVYLGLIHHPDAIAAVRKRIAAARRQLADFGIASVCGFGRLDPSAVPAILDDHRRALEVMHEFS